MIFRGSSWFFCLQTVALMSVHNHLSPAGSQTGCLGGQCPSHSTVIVALLSRQATGVTLRQVPFEVPAIMSVGILHEVLKKVWCS